MNDTALDLSAVSPTSLIHEVDTGLGVFIDAADVAEKFAAFLPSGVGAALAEAVKILSAVKSVVDKLPQ